MQYVRHSLEQSFLRVVLAGVGLTASCLATKTSLKPTEHIHLSHFAGKQSIHSPIVTSMTSWEMFSKQETTDLQ